MNYWYFLYLAIVPLLIFTVTPKHSAKRKRIHILTALGIGCLLLNLAMIAKWERRSDYINSFPNPTFEQLRWATAGDGGQVIVMLFLAAFFVSWYAGIWELLWRAIYKRKYLASYFGVSNFLIASSVFVFFSGALLMVPADGFENFIAYMFNPMHVQEFDSDYVLDQ